MKNFGYIEEAIRRGYRVKKDGEIIGLYGRPLVQMTSKSGYKFVNLYAFGRKKSLYVHQIVWVYFYTSSPACLNHINGNKKDNRVENLESSTPSANTFHAYKNKLIVPSRGQQHYKAKLSDVQIADAREQLFSGERICTVAKMFKVSAGYMWNIKHGRTRV